MVQRTGTIFIIVTVLLLLHSNCLAASRSTISSSPATSTTPTAPSTATTPSNESTPTPAPATGTPAMYSMINLVVDGGISYMPVQNGMVTPGASMTLGFTIKNVGSKESGDKGTYSIKCTVISGGECPVASVSNKPVPNLAPGASKSFTLMQAIFAEKGKYRVIITAQPSSSRGRPRQVEFTVGDTVLKKVKPPKATR